MRTGVALVALAVASCTDVTAPSDALIGRWEATGQLGGTGYRSEVVDFGRDGYMDHEIRIYQAGRLSETIRRTYAFTFRNDSLFTASEDYIANSVGLMTPFNRGHVVIEGTKLRIAYPWIGAADEPITRIDQFTREGCVRISLKWCV